MTGSIDTIERAHYEKEVERLAGSLGMTRDELIKTVRLSLYANAAPAPEFSVRILGSPIGTNTAYAPVVFTPKKGPRGGRPVAAIRLTKEGERWRDNVALHVLHARPRDWRLDAARYEVRTVYYFGSHSSDLDGPGKLLLDALKRVAYDDDRLVGHFDVWKYVDRENPRIEITVRILRDSPPRQEALFGARSDRSAGRG